MFAGFLSLLADATVAVETAPAETAPTDLQGQFWHAISPIWNLNWLNFGKALVVLVVGFAVAKFAARWATTLFDKLGLQTAADRSGLAQSMKQVGIVRNVPSILGLIVFWLLLSVAIMVSFNLLGWTTLSSSMQDVVAYIPKVLVATVVIVVGLLLASFLRGVIATSADRVGISYAEHLASACYYFLAVITFLAAAQHVNLEVPLLREMILIAFTAVSLGFALAAGLGGRDVMGGILAGYYLRQRFQSGDHVRLPDLEGTVREVGPVATIVETRDEGFVSRRSVPNHVMLKDAIR